MSSRSVVHFSDSGDARERARRLLSAQRTAGQTLSELPRFESQFESQARVTSHPPEPASWATFLAETAGQCAARAAFVSNPEGLLISAFGELPVEDLEAVSARFSLALDQASKIAETNQPGELVQRSAGDSVWVCMSIPCSAGFFFVGCLLASPPSATWLGAEVEKKMTRQVRALSGEEAGV